MTKRYCDTGRIDCPHLPECIWDCKYDTAVVERRKVKAYPIVPEDIKPVPEAWQIIGSVLVGFGIVALAVICILLFFTGVWIWSLLI
jgi:hypothetical protein